MVSMTRREAFASNVENVDMTSHRVLVVDDEEDLLELVRYNLSKEGFQVHCVSSGEEAIQAARTLLPDVILLDLMLPAVDGLSVCKVLKSSPQTQQIPVVMLTAKTAEADVVSGLEMGADDYVTKPFSPRVLLARLRAVLRRKPRQASEDGTSAIRVHELVIHLARKPGWAFSRNQIVDAVKGEDYPVTERSVDVQVAGLRKKLGDLGHYIETVRGVGYRFKE
jgi:two-component system alkaline phosphatase synthesis response regulator PhoP